MSKVGFWLRGSKGKLGGSYFSKGPEGSTVQHVIGEVKNPRTLAQMQQRMVMATCMAAYSEMKQIVNHSFEGLAYGQPNMSEFMKINAGLLRTNLTAQTPQFAYKEYGAQGMVPGAYQISKGSLQTPSFTYTVSSGEGQLTLAITGLSSGYTATALAAALGIAIDEMVTFCLVHGNLAANGFKFNFVRIRCKAVGNVALTAANFATYFDVESSMGAAEPSIASTTLTLLYGNVDINDAAAVQRAVIYSRQANNSWLRSTAVLNIPNGLVLAPTAETALATYPVGGDYVLNGGNV